MDKHPVWIYITNPDMAMFTAVPNNCTLITSSIIDHQLVNKATTETDPNQLQQYEALYEKLRFITGLIFYPIFCSLGLTGNVISLIVLSHKKMRSSTNTYLQALAISDSIKLINDFFYFFTVLFVITDPPIGNMMYGYLYPYAHYFFNMSVCCTAWLTVSVAAERYILVCHAAKAKHICSLDRSRVISVAVFVIMSILTIPLGLRYRTITMTNNVTNQTYLEVELTELWENEQFVLFYQWAQNFLRSIVPLLILIILNYFIIQALRRTRISRKRLSSRHRISLMLVSVIIVFLVCVTPDAIMSTFFGFGYYDANFLVRAVREITDLLLLFNSAVNFILYCTFNKLFRRRFGDLFCQCLGRWQIRRRYWTTTRNNVTGTLENPERREISAQASYRLSGGVIINGKSRLNDNGWTRYDETPPLFENDELSIRVEEELRDEVDSS